MNKVAVFILSLTLIAGAGTSSFAMSHMGGGKMMMMPKCSAGDPVVAVNMSTKMYRMHDKMDTSMHMGTKSKMAMQHGMMMHNMKMKHNMKLMCKSNADAMGAHMMKKNSM